MVGGVEIVLQVLQLNSQDWGVGEGRFLVLRCQEERVFTCRVQDAATTVLLALAPLDGEEG